MRKIYKKFSIFFIVIGIVLIVYSTITLALLLWGAFTSVKNVDAFRTNMLWLPKKGEWAFSNFSYVLSQFYVPIDRGGVPDYINISEQFVNSCIYVLAGAFLGAFFPCLVAYATNKYKYKFSSVVYFVVLIVMMLPIVGAQVSEIEILNKMNVFDTWIGLFLLKSNFMGMYYLIFYAQFSQLSDAYSEAAEIDGANEFQKMFKINFPLVRNTFFTIFLMLALGYWNDYSFIAMYMPTHPTLANGLLALSQSKINLLTEVPMRLAGCVMLAIPVLIVYLIFKDKFISNLTMGGVKG